VRRRNAIGNALSASILVSLLACAGVAAGQIAESQPDKYVGTPVQQRLEELITLIEGPNLPAAARRTAARELLRQGWPQTPPRLALVLSSDRGPARVAVAQALADLPEFLEPVYVEPLVAMLGDADGEARQSAAAALGGYRDAAVLQGLRELALDPNASPVLRRTGDAFGSSASSRRPWSTAASRYPPRAAAADCRASPSASPSIATSGSTYTGSRNSGKSASACATATRAGPRSLESTSASRGGVCGQPWRSSSRAAVRRAAAGRFGPSISVISSSSRCCTGVPTYLSGCDSAIWPAATPAQASRDTRIEADNAFPIALRLLTALHLCRPRRAHCLRRTE